LEVKVKMPEKIGVGLSKINPTDDLLSISEALEGSCERALAEVTITPDAGDNCYVKEVENIGSELTAIDATEDDLVLVLRRVLVDLQCESTKPFIGVPFLVILENGESPVATSGQDSNPLTAIDSAVTGHYILKLADTLVSRPFRDNGTKYHIAKGSFDITRPSIKFLNLWYKEGIYEESPLNMSFGMHTVSEDNNVTITVNVLTQMYYRFKKMKLMDL
jgi:hypothetical protein